MKGNLVSGEDWVKRFKSLKKPTAVGHRAWGKRDETGRRRDDDESDRQVQVGSVLI
jgi:uncharacterized protein (DUF2384 family)